MDDLISRHEALRALCNQVVGDKIWAFDARDAIEALSSAQPEPKTGKWIQHSIYVGSDLEYYYACSECDYRSWSQDNYCSVCGAKMEERCEVADNH